MAKTTKRKGNYKRKATPKKRTSYKKKSTTKYSNKRKGAKYSYKKKIGYDVSSKRYANKGRNFSNSKGGFMKSGAPWTKFRRTAGQSLNTFYNYFGSNNQIGFSIPGKRFNLDNQKPGYKTHTNPSEPKAVPQTGPIEPTAEPLTTITPHTADAPVQQPVIEPAPVAAQQAAPPQLEAPAPVMQPLPELQNQPVPIELQDDPERGRNKRAIGDVDRNYVPDDEDIALDADAIDEPNYEQSTTGALDMPVHNEQGQNGSASNQLVVRKAQGQPGWDLAAYETGRTRAVPGLFLDPALTETKHRDLGIPLVEGTGWDAVGSKWQLSGLWLQTTNAISNKLVVVKQPGKQTVAVIENSFTEDAQGNKSGRNVSPNQGWAVFARGIRERAQGHTAAGTLGTGTRAASEIANAYSTVRTGQQNPLPIPGAYNKSKKQIVDQSEPRLTLGDVVQEEQYPAASQAAPSSTNPNTPLSTYQSPTRTSRDAGYQKPPAPPKKKQKVQGANLRGDPNAAAPSDYDTRMSEGRYPRLPSGDPDAVKVNEAMRTQHYHNLQRQKFGDGSPEAKAAETDMKKAAANLTRTLDAQGRVVGSISDRTALRKFQHLRKNYVF